MLLREEFLRVRRVDLNFEVNCYFNLKGIKIVKICKVGKIEKYPEWLKKGKGGGILRLKLPFLEFWGIFRKTEKNTFT